MNLLKNWLVIRCFLCNICCWRLKTNAVGLVQVWKEKCLTICESYFGFGPELFGQIALCTLTWFQFHFSPCAVKLHYADVVVIETLCRSIRLSKNYKLKSHIIKENTIYSHEHNGVANSMLKCNVMKAIPCLIHGVDRFNFLQTQKDDQDKWWMIQVTLL